MRYTVLAKNRTVPFLLGDRETEEMVVVPIFIFYFSIFLFSIDHNFFDYSSNFHSQLGLEEVEKMVAVPIFI